MGEEIVQQQNLASPYLLLHTFPSLLHLFNTEMGLGRGKGRREERDKAQPATSFSWPGEKRSFGTGNSVIYMTA